MSETDLAPVVEYQRAHRRVYRLWGRARRYPCVSCGQPARQWAYDGTDPSERRGYDHTGSRKPLARPMIFSIWPEFYMPMCNTCHRCHDIPRLAWELQQEMLDNHCHAV